jgi:DNA repair protein RecN (Recombination protein N)
MLTELYVEHFVLIDALRLQFTQGLHVFTGETGAGKSLLLDATRLILGDRASAANVQRGFDHALVEAVFVVPPTHPAYGYLQDWGITMDEGTVVVSRTLYTSGRSICRVNGRTITVQMLKQLGDTLVEMQGQHESHALLSNRYQRNIVDLYGQHTHLSAQTAACYRTWQDDIRTLEQAQVSEQERARQIDMLKFQIEEIEAANLTPGEEDALREERHQLLAFDKLKSNLDKLLAALEDPSFGAIAQLSAAEAASREIAAGVDALDDIRQMVESARVNAEEASFGLNKYAAQIEADPRRLDEIETRIAALRTLMRKYGASSEEILAHLATAKATYAQLLAHDELLERHRMKVEQSRSDYLQMARQLHQCRVKAASGLQAQVQAQLHRLQMTDARFVVEVTADENQCSEDGYDKVYFLFSGNPGENLMPLQKVASGGELSRTLLALKVVVADLEQIDTLIFDEIDAGVSGEAAQSVAVMLRQLGEDRQVLCVTHAAQVAAAGHAHFQIVKDNVDGRAHTRIYALNTKKRRLEVGRLLGASVSDNTALLHADALLESFRIEPSTRP